MKDSLVVIVGPTAVGKSNLAVRLAQLVNGEIISGDSVQVYRNLNIGSAKITLAEQQGIPHHMLDILDPEDEFSVAIFQKLVRHYVEEINQRGKIPILVGGTGLYIRSILDPYEFPDTTADKMIRKRLQEQARQAGNEILHQRLAQVDPVSALRLHPNDLVRVVRALEVYELTGKPFSEYQKTVSQVLPAQESPYLLSYFGLNGPRDWLYERINQRVDHMLQEGLIHETKQLLDQGYYPYVPSLRTIGYRHAVQYLRGILNCAEMNRLLKRDTRRFAKRQLTWFRHDERITWFNVTVKSLEEIVQQMAEMICSAC